MTKRQAQSIKFLKCALADVREGGEIIDLKVITGSAREWRYWLDGKDRRELRKFLLSKPKGAKQ